MGNLNNKIIRQAKSSSKLQKMSDGAGLWLYITPSGKKLFKHRFKHNGKDCLSALGIYPAISLVQARDLMLAEKQQLKQGMNPNDEKKKLKAELARESEKLRGITFKELFDEFARYKQQVIPNRKPDWSYETSYRHGINFKNHVFPEMGDKPISLINEVDLENCLLKIQAHGTLSIRNKVLTVFKLMFRYAKGKRYIDQDPSLYISDALFLKHQEKHYRHLTTEHEIAQVIKQIKNMSAAYEIKQCLLIGFHIFLRPGELVGLRWDEIDFDKKEIHRATTKSSETLEPKILVIPMSQQVEILLIEMHSYSSCSDYVFLTSYGSSTRPITRDSLSKALRRNGITQINPHGIRHTASTALNNSGIDSDAIELQLNHSLGGVRGVYNKANKLAQRKEMMKVWSDYLDALVSKEMKVCA